MRRNRWADRCELHFLHSFYAFRAKSE